MKEKQIIRNQVYVVLLALLFIVTLGFGAVSAEASTSRDNRMEQVVAPVNVEAVFGSPFRIHKEFTLEFDANGGSGKQSAVFSSNGSIKLPKCRYTKTGYHFTGWKIGTHVYPAGSDFPCDSYGSTTATAQWAANSYTIYFEANEGTGTQTPISTTYGATVTLPECSFTRKGYTFAGWKIGNHVYSAGDKVRNLVPSGHVEATAQWKANTYTIAFASNNGTGTMPSITVRYDEARTLPKCAFSYTGSSFNVWKWNNQTYANETSVINLTDKDGVTLTFTAQWKVNSYTIAFGANGGSGTQTPISTTYGATVTLPECSFARTGYTFAGWKINGTVYKAGARVKNLCTGGQVTATAQWKANTYKVTFMDGNTKVSTQDVTYGSTYGSLPNLTITGTGSSSRKARWFTKQKPGEGTEITAATKVTITGPQTLYAKWEMLVMFDINGGRDSNTSQAYLIGEVFGKLPSDPTPPNSSCRFDGWYTKAVGGTKIKTTTTVTSSHTKLYAHYVVNVKFDTNGGSGNIAGRIYTVGENYNSLPIDPKAPSISKKFSGWYTEKEKGIKISTAMTVKATYTTLYAHWEPNKVSVTFDANGGTYSGSPKDVVIGENYGRMTAAKKPGNTFLGWFTQKSGGTRVEANTKVTATTNHTLYAHWEADSKFTFEKLLNPSGSSDEPNPFERYAHNIYCDPGLSPEEKKVGFTGFVIDFYTDREAVGTYWALCNWQMNTDAMQAELKATSITPPQCYAGLQFTTDGPKSNIAFWRTKYVLNNDKNHPKYIYARDKLVYPNRNMSLFDNEGVGMQYLTTYNWSPNKWYRMYIECYDDADGYTLVSQYIQDVSTGKWTTICTVNTNLKHSYFVGDMSQFMENYQSTNINLIRTFGYRNIYVKKRNGGWKFISSATLSTDDNPNKKGVAALGCSNTVLYGITCGYGSSSNSEYAKLKLVCPGLSPTLSSSSPVLPTNRHNK